MPDARTNEGSCVALYIFVGIRYHELSRNQSSFDFRISLTETRAVHHLIPGIGIKAERSDFCHRREYLPRLARDIEMRDARCMSHFVSVYRIIAIIPNEGVNAVLRG